MSLLDRHVSLVQSKITFGVFLRALAWTLLGFCAVIWFAVLIDRVLGVHLPRQVVWFWTSLGGAVFAAATYTIWRRPTAHEAAVAIDEKLSLKEKFSTALFVRASRDPFAAAAVRDAERTAESVFLGKQFPIKLPRIAMGTVGVALLAFLTAQFLGPMNLFGGRESLRKTADQEQRRAEAERAVKKALATIEQAPKAVAENAEIQTAKKDLEALTRRPITDPTRAQRSALKALQDVEAVKQKIKDNQLFASAQNEMKNLKSLTPPATDTGPVSDAHRSIAKGEFSDAIEDLKAAVNNFDKMEKKDQKKAADQMANLAAQLQKMANDPKQQKQAENQLQKMGANQQQAKQMMQALQNAANGNKQAQQQLQQLANQMMQQMNNGNGPSKQQQQQVQQMMQQMQAQANNQAQAQAMAQAAQQMAQCMQQGAQQGQGQGQQGKQQMAQAQQAMQQQLQNMQAQSQAQQAIAAQQGQGGGQGGQPGQNGQPNKGGQGQWAQGNPNQQGQGMGGPGIGNGGKASKEEAPYDVVEKVSSGAVNEKGKILARSFVKVPSMKGESKMTLSEAAAAAEKDATDEVDQDRISRPAAKVVKDYFGALKEEKE